MAGGGVLKTIDEDHIQKDMTITLQNLLNLTLFRYLCSIISLMFCTDSNFGINADRSLGSWDKRQGSNSMGHNSILNINLYIISIVIISFWFLSKQFYWYKTSQEII